MDSIEPNFTHMPRASEGVIAYISSELKEKLEKMAEQQDRSISWLVGRWIEEKVEEFESAETKGSDRP